MAGRLIGSSLEESSHLSVVGVLPLFLSRFLKTTLRYYWRSVRTEVWRDEERGEWERQGNEGRLYFRWPDDAERREPLEEEEKRPVEHGERKRARRERRAWPGGEPGDAKKAKCPRDSG